LSDPHRRRKHYGPVTEKALSAAEEAVRWLVERCHRGSRLYQRAPRAVAQVSRTGKWHLNAIAQLRKELDISDDPTTAEADKKRGA
jgi:hypothetical protein